MEGPDQNGLQSYDTISGYIVRFDDYEGYRNSGLISSLDILWGPAHILSDCSNIILNVVYLRIIHLLIDSCNFNVQNTNLIKDIATIILGLVQLRDFAYKYDLVAPVNTMIIYYAALVIIRHVIVIRGGAYVPSLFTTLLAAPLFVNEYYIFAHQRQNLTTVRSILACLIMKSSSIILTPGIPIKNISSRVAYLLHPAASVFGVWQPIETAGTRRHINDASRQFSRFKQQVCIALVYSFKTIIILIIYVNLAELASFVDSVMDHAFVKTLLRMYFVALEFRTSHYFTGFVSTSLISLWQDPAVKERFVVCQPIKIECPRSLLEVVRFWNLPMHYWLKHHVFWPVKQHTSSIYISLGLTYIVSSTLHGCKFHIWAVLLTLGFLTWTEHQLRLEISRRLSACVLSSRCKYNSRSECCRGHQRNPNNSFIVQLVNLAFTILAMIYLAYLGYIFVGNTDEASYTKALARWSEVYFFAHLTSIATYISLRAVQTQ